MDKPTEQQPLDSLFRRKLGEASVSPSVEAWERLQSRLVPAQSVEESAVPHRRLGGWLWYGSAAVGVAACLLLVFVWTKPERSQTPPQSTVASSGIVQPKSPGKNLGKPEQTPQVPAPSQGTKQTQLAGNTGDLADLKSPREEPKTVKAIGDDTRLVQHKAEDAQKTQSELIKQNGLKETPLVAQVQNVEPSQQIPAQTTPTAVPSTKLPVVEAERTLIVQVPDISAKSTATIASVNDNNKARADQAGVKETKLGRAFRQIKRIKDGEVFAKADDTRAEDDDESGLFDRLVRSGRAKDNTTKQQK